MSSVKDVAQYVLEQAGVTNTIKLQKLVYYCQAWAMVWTDRPLFQEHIEAWANGPVVPELFQAHRGEYQIDANFGIGDSSLLDNNQKQVINSVLATYGDKSSQWLVQLTHMEEPWKNARNRAYVDPGERSTEPIPLDEIHHYYAGLLR